MKEYIGTKRLVAQPMTRIKYVTYRGWDLPEDENGSDEGYLVEYLDGGEPNHSDHQGYISWSPKDVFEKAYRETDGLTFGEAMEACKMGAKIQRKGWNGKNMWLVYVPGSSPPELAPDSPYKKAGLDQVDINPHIDMMTATGQMQPGWVASQPDMLSDDWIVFD